MLRTRTRPRVPEAHAAIPTGRGGQAAVGRHRDRRDLAPVSGKAMQQRAGADIPQAHGAVVADRYEALAIRQEGHRIDPCLVPLQTAQRPLIGDAPKHDAVIETGGRGKEAIR